MRSTGIVRKVDDLGRIVIPKELRRTLNIDKKDPLEIHVEGNRIVLRKQETMCAFCGSEENLTNIRGKTLCLACLDEIRGANRK